MAGPGEGFAPYYLPHASPYLPYSPRPFQPNAPWNPSLPHPALPVLPPQTAAAFAQYQGPQPASGLERPVSDAWRGPFPSGSTSQDVRAVVGEDRSERELARLRRGQERMVAMLSAGATVAEADRREAEREQLKRSRVSRAGSTKELITFAWPRKDWSLVKLVKIKDQLLTALRRMGSSGGFELESSFKSTTIPALYASGLPATPQPSTTRYSLMTENDWNSLAFITYCKWCRTNQVNTLPFTGSVIACFLLEEPVVHRYPFIFVLEKYRLATCLQFTAGYVKPPAWTVLEEQAWLYLVDQGTKPLMSWRAVVELTGLGPPGHAPAPQPSVYTNRAPPPPNIPSTRPPAPNTTLNPAHSTSLHHSHRPPLQSSHSSNTHSSSSRPTINVAPPMSAKAQGKRREVDPVALQSDERAAKRPRQVSGHQFPLASPLAPSPTPAGDDQATFMRAIHDLKDAMTTLYRIRGLHLGDANETGGARAANHPTSSTTAGVSTSGVSPFTSSSMADVAGIATVDAAQIATSYVSFSRNQHTPSIPAWSHIDHEPTPYHKRPSLLTLTPLFPRPLNVSPRTLQQPRPDPTSQPLSRTSSGNSGRGSQQSLVAGSLLQTTAAAAAAMGQGTIATGGNILSSSSSRWTQPTPLAVAPSVPLADILNRILTRARADAVPSNGSPVVASSTASNVPSSSTPSSLHPNRSLSTSTLDPARTLPSPTPSSSAPISSYAPRPHYPFALQAKASPPIQGPTMGTLPVSRQSVATTLASPPPEDDLGVGMGSKGDTNSKG